MALYAQCTTSDFNILSCDIRIVRLRQSLQVDGLSSLRFFTYLLHKKGIMRTHGLLVAGRCAHFTSQTHFSDATFGSVLTSHFALRVQFKVRNCGVHCFTKFT